MRSDEREVDENGHMRDWQERRARFDARRNPDAAQGLRRIMDHLGAVHHCRHGRCRRAGRCAAPGIDCAFQNLDLLQTYVFPELLRIGLASGKFSPDEFSPAVLAGVKWGEGGPPACVVTPACHTPDGAKTRSELDV